MLECNVRRWVYEILSYTCHDHMSCGMPTIFEVNFYKFICSGIDV